MYNLKIVKQERSANYCINIRPHDEYLAKYSWFRQAFMNAMI